MGSHASCHQLQLVYDPQLVKSQGDWNLQTSQRKARRGRGKVESTSCSAWEIPEDHRQKSHNILRSEWEFPQMVEFSCNSHLEFPFRMLNIPLKFPQFLQPSPHGTPRDSAQSKWAAPQGTGAPFVVDFRKNDRKSPNDALKNFASNNLYFLGYFLSCRLCAECHPFFCNIFEWFSKELG